MKIITQTVLFCRLHYNYSTCNSGIDLFDMHMIDID